MTTWTEETNTTASYETADKINKAGTTWDGGDTIWDVRGNVETTLWDVTETSYTTVSSSGTTTWTPV